MLYYINKCFLRGQINERCFRGVVVCTLRFALFFADPFIIIWRKPGLHEFLESIHDEWLHAVLITPIVIILGISLPKAYLSHRNPVPAYLAALGVFTLTVGVLSGHLVETILTVVGSTLVISAHLINRKSLKSHVEAVMS